jgi:hypothetical protein
MRRRRGASIYNQSIPDYGYTYLTTGDGTQLAIDVHPPTSLAGEPGLPLGLPVPPGLPNPPSLPFRPCPLRTACRSRRAWTPSLRTQR